VVIPYLLIAKIVEIEHYMDWWM